MVSTILSSGLLQVSIYQHVAVVQGNVGGWSQLHCFEILLHLVLSNCVSACDYSAHFLVEEQGKLGEP